MSACSSIWLARCGFWKDLPLFWKLWQMCGPYLPLLADTPILFIVQLLDPLHQAVSTAIMVLPPLFLLIAAVLLKEKAKRAEAKE